MADDKQIEILMEGVETWQKWRDENPATKADLRCALLDGADLHGADLTDVDLTHAFLHEANLCRADLRRATLIGTNFCRARLCGAKLSGADLHRANLDRADLTGADLSDANLERTLLVRTKVSQATFTRCRVYGASAWDLDLKHVKDQSSLRITRDDEPGRVTVDNLEVAQFVYLMLHNQKIRGIIDTIGRKSVLILGRFTEARKAVLDALKERLRRDFDLVPMVFDWDKPTRRDLTETVQLLANMSRFVVADVTDAKSIPQELSHIVPFLPSVPVCPIILASQLEYSMFEHWTGYSTMLPVIEYHDQEQLVGNIEQQLLARVKEWEAGYDKTKALEKASREKDEALREKDRQLAALLAENNELKKQL